MQLVWLGGTLTTENGGRVLITTALEGLIAGVYNKIEDVMTINNDILY